MATAIAGQKVLETEVTTIGPSRLVVGRPLSGEKNTTPKLYLKTQ